MPKKTAFARNQRGPGAPATIVEELRAALWFPEFSLQRQASLGSQVSPIPGA